MFLTQFKEDLRKNKELELNVSIKASALNET